MAQDDHSQSLDDSSGIPPAPDNSASPLAAGVVAPLSVAAAAAADAQLPTATTDSSAATSTATSTSSPSTVAALATPSASAAGVSASTAAPAASIADLQQNGDSRASEPEVKSDSDMSNQHPGAPHGLPVSYPGSSSPYTSAAGIPSGQYASYPTVSSQPPEAYRPNPVPIGSNNMSLPSMRTIDSMQQQPGTVGGSPHAMGMNVPMAPASGGMPGFYGHHNMGMAQGYGLPSDAIARYALPHDPRLLGHRGPKKCDETHPTCNNCKKSKRECLGYDPIFRQQPGGQPTTNIQPAPSTQLTPPSTLPSSVPSSVPSSAPVIGPRTNSYGNQPSMLPSSYATSQASTSTPIPSTIAPPPYDSTLSALAPPVKPEPGYEYQAPSIDPALQTLPSNTQSSVQDSSRSLDRKPYFDNNFHLRGGAPYA
ncbi:Fc.00g063170.m01.CDS01 [Cosmosporella sp. VM-42]